VPQHGFYQGIHLGLSEALRELGHETVDFPFAAIGQPSSTEAEVLYRIVQSGSVDAVLDLACWGFGLSRVTVPTREGGSEPVFVAGGIPYFAILLDHPHNQALNGILAQPLFAAYPDLGHCEQVRFVYPDLKTNGEIFAPPAVRGNYEGAAQEQLPAQDIDLLYVGNLAPAALQRFWNDRGSRLWESAHDPEFCDVLADIALAQPERSLHLSVQTAIAQTAAKPPGFDFKSQIRAVECFLRYRFRHAAVMAMAQSGLQMTVVGRGWDTAELPVSVEQLPPTSYDGIFRLAGRAKICLDASTYLDGANDRVFNYAFNRAVCFTNAAGYLRRAFSGRDDIRFYSMRNLTDLGEQAKLLLAAPRALREAGNNARQTVLAAHTWRHRVESILSVLRRSSAD